MNLFQTVPPSSGDPILSLVAEFLNDPRPSKINLSIGYYYDEKGQVPILRSVKKALYELEQLPLKPSFYLPMSGLARYCDAVQTLLFGEGSKARQQKRIATIQSFGGSGALKMGADFLHRYFPESEVWVSDPTWSNHIAIFESAGFKVQKYPYYDLKQQTVQFEAMMQTLESLPARTIVLLHPCCHNPTGADLTISQWNRLLTMMKQKQLIPFMDIAYQGFGQGLEEDAYAIRALEQLDLLGLVANSFSKNASIYGERVGALSVLCESADVAKNVKGQLESVVRENYSSPALFGARLVDHILNAPELKQQWEEEIIEMRDRILMMRKALVEHLRAIDPSLDVGHFLVDQGMFSYTGLSVEQVNALRETSAVYLVGNGRLCIAGLTEQNVETVAKALAPFLK